MGNEQPQPAISEDLLKTARAMFDKSWSGHTTMPDPIVEQALEGGELLGMSLPKPVTAGLAGMGYEMADPWIGLAQALKGTGNSSVIDEETQDQNERIMRALSDDSRYDAATWTGRGAGLLAEPLGFLLPAAKAKTAAGALLYSGILGATYGSATYIEPQESRITNAALGAALMGPLGVVMHGVSKHFTQAIGRDVEDAINKSGEHLMLPPPPQKLLPPPGKVVTHYDPWAKDSPLYVLSKVVKQATKKPATKEEIAVDNVAGLEARITTRGPRARRLAAVRTYVDSFFQPIYNNIKKYNNKVAIALRRVDFDTHRDQKVWTDQIKPFKEMFESMPLKMQEKFHSVLLNEGLGKTAMNMAGQHGGDSAVKTLTDSKKLLNEIIEGYKKAGYHMEGIEEYFPRAVSNLDGISQKNASIIDKALDRARKASSSGTLTSKQEARVVERLLTHDPRFSSTSGNLKERLIKEVEQDQLEYYHDPVSALYYYAHTAAEDLSNRRFFASFGYKPGKKGLDITGGDIDKSIDSLMDTLKKELPDHKDRNDMVKLLRSRFNADVHNTNDFIQGLKNLSYAGTLGNFWSAMTQVGDIVFAFHKYGIANAVQSILGPKISTKESLGITKAMQELNSSKSKTSKIADWAFKWGGFDAVDAWGKNVNLNSSLRANRKLAIKNPEKFRAKWGETFGDEVDNVIYELRNLKLSKGEQLSDNTNFMLWNDLADTQPIGLSEMPQKYLDMPNGRVFYAYKTFTLKQMNYMREILMRGEGGSMKRASNLVYFATLFTFSNASIDYFKDFMSGKDIDFEDNVLDNVAGLLGTNKYAVDKSLRGGNIGSLLMEGFKPVPITQFSKVSDTAGKALMGEIDVPKIASKAPVFGKPYKALRDWDILP